MAKKKNGSTSNGGKKQPEETRVSPSHMNRTGIAASPIHGRQMIESSEQGTPTMMADGHAAVSMRQSYIKGAEPVGTVPPPTTMKGVAKAAVQAVKGERPTVLIDKIAERLAFERTGTRLYEGLLTKLDTLGSFDGGPSRQELVHFHDEERQHFALLKESLEQLGADPTAVTPSADITAVESMGVLQVIGDPRTTLPQCLHALLVAELVDRESWEMLVQMARKAGQDDMAQRFQRAESEEEEHLSAVRRWVSRYSMSSLEGRVSGTGAQPGA